MLDQNTRTSILKLREKGHGTRKIARALGISRKAVCRVIESGNSAVPIIERREMAEPYREQILELHAACKGHLGRVHEELVKQGATLSYQALTGFCRRHGIGYEAPLPAGRYEFAPGEEMQHDTSPHRAKIRGVLVKVETASLVLCYSRMLYFQMYPRFRRFECKVFLTDALGYFGGAAGRCMIDNTHVVVLKGTGKTMVPVPEMVAFGQRFGFVFAAHEVGDANRSARVEGPFNWGAVQLAAAAGDASVTPVPIADERAAETESSRAHRQDFAADADLARHMAGNWGDPVKTAENLPGVVPATADYDGIVLWGARPGDSRALVDGIEIPGTVAALFLDVVNATSHHNSEGILYYSPDFRQSKTFDQEMRIYFFGARWQL